MFILLAPPARHATVRRVIGALTMAVAGVVADIRATRPAPVAPVTAVEPVAAPDPVDVYAPDELPAIEIIEAVVSDFDAAAEQARTADRGKRRARKLLDRLPAGVYGAWIVDRIESNR